MAVLAAYRRHRFAWLFASLLLTLAVGPTLQAVAPGQSPLAVLLAMNLLAAIASAARDRHMALALALGAAFVGTRAVLAVLGVPGILAVTEVVWVIVIALATVASVRHAFRSHAVDAEHILAALDAYLLVGLLFAVAYWMLGRTLVGSFGGPGHDLDLSSAIYFSFVTIATLGYGDVVPTSPPARGLAMVESVSGQMYLAVLVARLVSLYSQRDRE